MSRWRSFSTLIVGLCLLVAGFPASAQDTRPGQLAVVGVDGNLALIGADGEVTPLTQDAGPNGSILRFYQWPTWAPSGGLAFFATELTRQGDRTLEMWATDATRAPALVYSAPGVTFTYAYASPQACPGSDSCAPVATLISGTGADGFELTLVPTDGSAAQTVGQGAPFYFDWSPDGAQMAWHRNDSRLDLFAVDQRRGRRYAA